MSIAKGHGPTTVRLEGVFDLLAAKRVGAQLDRVARDEQLCIDASKVVHFEDFGIATLAQALSRIHCLELRLVGFRTHQLRLMKYFGYDATSLGEAPPAL